MASIAVGLLTLFVVSSWALRAEGAEITAPAEHIKASRANDKVSAYWPTDPVQCDLILDGPIVEGDTAQLKRHVEAISETWNSFSFFLCLRSPGGSVKEALELSKLVRATQRPSIATVVEDGQVCASACALIFLAGNAPARVGAFPQRFLHPRARLLYHASRLDLSGHTDQSLMQYLMATATNGGGLKSRVSALYKDGIQDVQGVMDTFKGQTYQREVLGVPWVRPSLFLEMFAQDPNEWICIDSVDAAGRWNMQVFGYKMPAAPTPQQHFNFCRNAFHWRADEFVAGSEDIEIPEKYETLWPAATKRIGGQVGGAAAFRFTFGLQAPMSQVMCVGTQSVRKGSKLTEQDSIETFFAASDGDERISDIQTLAPFAYFSADTLLRDLPGVRAPGAAGEAAPGDVGFRKFANSTMDGCTLKRFASTSVDDCQQACSKASGCKAYSLNRMLQHCELKHTLTAVRLDPASVSGAPNNAPMPLPSSRRVGMASNFYRVDGVEGQVIGTKVAESDVCKETCETDHTCFAAEHDLQTNACRIFSSVSSFKARIGDQPMTKWVFLKRQL